MTQTTHKHYINPVFGNMMERAFHCVDIVENGMIHCKFILKF
jgi:hypothetical protein